MCETGILQLALSCYSRYVFTRCKILDRSERENEKDGATGAENAPLTSPDYQDVRSISRYINVDDDICKHGVLKFFTM